jgi:hypothetical protein
MFFFVRFEKATKKRALTAAKRSALHVQLHMLNFLNTLSIASLFFRSSSHGRTWVYLIIQFYTFLNELNKSSNGNLIHNNTNGRSMYQ